MAKSYEEYEREELEKARKQQAEFVSRQQAAIRRETDQALSRLEQKAAPDLQKAAGQAEQVSRDAARDYDLSAVRQLVTQRQLKEQLANLGLTHSGYSDAAHKGAAQAKRVRDLSVWRDTKDKISTLRATMEKLYTNLRLAKEEKRAALEQQGQTAAEKNEAALVKEAKARAKERYRAQA